MILTKENEQTIKKPHKSIVHNSGKGTNLTKTEVLCGCKAMRICTVSKSMYLRNKMMKVVAI